MAELGKNKGFTSKNDKKMPKLFEQLTDANKKVFTIAAKLLVRLSIFFNSKEIMQQIDFTKSII